jgi:hypothetical protein
LNVIAILGRLEAKIVADEEQMKACREAMRACLEKMETCQEVTTPV